MHLSGVKCDELVLGKASVDSLDVILSLSALTQGATYTLMLTAEDSQGSSSYSSVTLAVNEPPSSGQVVVAPRDGFTLDTAFTFAAVNWVDEDLPMTYIFGTVPIVDPQALAVDTSAAARRPFGDARSDASLSGVSIDGHCLLTRRRGEE